MINKFLNIMETTNSPTNEETIDESRQMDFPEAIRHITKGKKVHKLEWKDKAYYGFLNGEFLSLHKPDGKNYKWIVNEGDLTGTDYIIV